MSILSSLFGNFWKGEQGGPYGFKDTRQPGPGTQEYAFQPLFFLPPNALLGYGGVNVQRALREYPANPQIFHNIKVTNASAGGAGVIAGTLYGQPLLSQDATGTNSNNATG
jgi:hypothetical protein